MGRGLKGLFRRQGDWYSVGPHYGGRYGVIIGTAFLIVCLLVTWRFFLRPETVPKVGRHAGSSLGSIAPGRGIPTQRPLRVGPTYQQQVATGKEMVDDLVSGRIRGDDLEALKGLPEFDDCRSCLDECERNSPAKGRAALDLGAEQCRRDCLAHCSTVTRWLMNQ